MRALQFWIWAWITRCGFTQVTNYEEGLFDTADFFEDPVDSVTVLDANLGSFQELDLFEGSGIDSDYMEINLDDLMKVEPKSFQILEEPDMLKEPPTTPEPTSETTATTVPPYKRYLLRIQSLENKIKDLSSHNSQLLVNNTRLVSETEDLHHTINRLTGTLTEYESFKQTYNKVYTKAADYKNNLDNCQRKTKIMEDREKTMSLDLKKLRGETEKLLGLDSGF